ncbi:TetR/AcrR family transcriptional regulator [Corynebacterium sp. TAE3-ERU12]|uniref:TetR/AcrR family transcriptional regulator n=1 Tax=Corynebacterium sp. TAE3-ERU12 TaxID=2849491 RepID=UPI001C492156|nr:TetR/AcrR family transcriptional regulator [Corynebacterium sp. TAE3-ERU12]
MTRRRMSTPERRQQLLAVGRATFAQLGFDGASMEELAARAGVSKPVVYEHFGSKEVFYNAVVAEEMQRLEGVIAEVISLGRARVRIERAVLALLTYVEENPDGFSIVVRDPASTEGFKTLLGNATGRVAHILGQAFTRANLDESTAVLYAQAMVGMVSQTAQWWLDERGTEDAPDKETVAAHVVNLCWNGLAGMEVNPQLQSHALEIEPEEGVRLGAGPDADPAGRTLPS